jgi:long-chain acyl-CoA synthetase
MNLASLLFDAGTRPDASPPAGAALVHVADDLRTRAEIESQATELAGELRAAGVGPGRAVAVMLPDGFEVIAALFGVWSARAVYVPLNPRATAAEIGRLLASVKPAAIVTTAEQAERFQGSCTVVPAGRGWRRSAEPAASTARHDPDVALIQFTSGTTGRPKPVLLLHSGVLALLDGVIRKLRSGTAKAASPMPNLIPVSLSLWAGIYNVLFAFRVGAPIVILGPFDTQRFAEVVRRFGIRSTVLPPAAMTMLADDESIADLSPLRYVRSITAPLSPLQARRFRDRFGIAVLNSYGQTEIGGEIVGWNASDSRQFGETKLGSVGRPHEGVELRIVDDHGGVVATDQSGELWVRTPALSAGYADGTDLGDRLTGDGWFRTGDQGRVDADGFLWIEGRVSDMINRGGLKVFPAEVEEVLRLAPDVVDAAVIGMPDDRLGEVPWAFVEPRGGAADPRRLDDLCRQHLVPFKVPAGYSSVESLPRNSIGKVVKAELVRTVAATATDRER